MREQNERELATFVVTKASRRFTAVCDACRRFRGVWTPRDRKNRVCQILRAVGAGRILLAGILDHLYRVECRR